MKMSRIRHQWPTQQQLCVWGSYGIVIGTMWVLKRHYSSATAQDLVWILTPVAAIVDIFDELAYGWKTGIGWVRADEFIIIAPACAGVNFLIMLFGLNTLAFLHRLKALGRCLLWLPAVLLAAYGLTICVNSLRIMISIFFYDHHVQWHWFTQERLHRIIGVTIYFPVLGLSYLLADRIMTRLNLSSCIGWLACVRWPLQPLLGYLAGTVLVPFCYAAYRGNPHLSAEHCITVVGVSSILWLAGGLSRRLIKRKIYATRRLNRGR